MLTEENNVYYAPLGDSRGHPLDTENRNNTIERLVNLEELLKHTESKNIAHIEELISQGNSDMAIWGMNEKYKKIEKSIKENDLVFLGYKNCVLYIGQVKLKIRDKKMTEFLWRQKDGWQIKVFLKNVIKVYIPGNLAVRKHEDLKIDIKNEEDLDIIYNLVKKGQSFRSILGIELDKTFYLQGINDFPNTNANEVSKRLTEFLFRTNFRSLIKTISMED